MNINKSKPYLSGAPSPDGHETYNSKRWRGPCGSRKPGLVTSQTEASVVPPPPQDHPDSVYDTTEASPSWCGGRGSIAVAFLLPPPCTAFECKEPETAPAAGKAAEPSKAGSSSSATAAAAFSSPPGSSAADLELLLQRPEYSDALRPVHHHPHTHPLPPSTAATPPPRPLRSPSLDWSRDKSNGKRRARTLPADPGRGRTGPGAFPRLAGAPNPPPPPRAPLPDFRKFAKNSPHEFSCPADPRWRRIHRGGCWEQDLYPLTAAVTPVAPASLRVAAEGGSGDCKAAAMGEACCSSAAVTESGASAAATVFLGPGCFAEGSGPKSEGDRRVQGR
nr:translation initiation factor IF-2-like [Macaca fascicularis]